MSVPSMPVPCLCGRTGSYIRSLFWLKLNQPKTLLASFWPSLSSSCANIITSSREAVETCSWGCFSGSWSHSRGLNNWDSSLNSGIITESKRILINPLPITAPTPPLPFPGPFDVFFQIRCWNKSRTVFLVKWIWLAPDNCTFSSLFEIFQPAVLFTSVLSFASTSRTWNHHTALLSTDYEAEVYNMGVETSTGFLLILLSLSIMLEIIILTYVTSRGPAAAPGKVFLSKRCHAFCCIERKLESQHSDREWVTCFWQRKKVQPDMRGCRTKWNLMPFRATSQKAAAGSPPAPARHQTCRNGSCWLLLPELRCQAGLDFQQPTGVLEEMTQ